MATRFWRKQKQSSAERELLDNQHVVLHFKQAPRLQTSEDEVGAADGWAGMGPMPAEADSCEVLAHLGFVNRGRWNFTALCLHSNVTELLPDAMLDELPLDSDVLQACVKTQLQSGESLCVLSDVELFSQPQFNLEKSWSVQILRVSLQERHWQQSDTSSTVVPLVPLEGDQPFLLWRGWDEEQRCQAAAKKKPGKRTAERAPPAVRAAGAAAAPAQKRRRPGGGPPKPVPVADGAENLLERIVQVEEDIAAALEPSEQEVFDEGATSEDENEDPEPSLAGSNSGSEAESAESEDPTEPDACDEAHVVQQLLEQLDGQPPAGGPDLPPNRQSAQQPAAAAHANPEARVADNEDEEVAARQVRPAPAARAARDGEAAPRRPDFEKHELEFPPYGRLRYYPHTHLLIAVCSCPVHGDCRLARTTTKHPRARSLSTTIGGQGRPIGLQAAWLKAQAEYDCQQTHVHLCRPNRQARIEARAEFLELEGAVEFSRMAERRRDTENGEEEEPARIT